MTDTMTDEQALCLHLMASLALPFTLPSDRVTSLALLREHLPCLMAERFAAMRLAADSMLRAKTHLEWSFAAHEATAALVPVFKAESCRIIASLSVKRVA